MILALLPAERNGAVALSGPFLSEPDTSPTAVFTAARSYVQAGLSVIPIAADMTKSPAARLLPHPWEEATKAVRPSWKIYQVRRPTEPELSIWFDPASCSPDHPGIGIVAGAVSGGLEILDFDTADLFEPWSAQVQARYPGLCQRLVRVLTPRPGIHVYYRCGIYTGPETLAWEAHDQEGTTLTGDQLRQRPKRRALIEKKGEGNYCLAPPSPRFCHPSQTVYCLAPDSPPLTDVPTISAAERQILLDAARSFNRWHEPTRSELPPAQANRVQHGDSSRPGDDFNGRGRWEDVLVPHGWTCEKIVGEVAHWRRPGKDEGTSATTNYADSDLLYVFSTNADPFEERRGYTKFTAYALLKHGGDFRAAATALRKQGYGRSRPGQKRVLS